MVVDTVSRGGNGELATALTLGAENGGDETAAVETLLAAASLGVSLCDAPFLLRLACWLNRARRKERGKQGGEGGPSPVAALRAAVLQRVVEDAATTMPPFSQLDTLDMSAPELAHELLVWLLTEGTFSSDGGEVTSGGKGSDGGFASLPPFLASVLLGWLMRKPELLLPLAVGGSDDSDVTEVPTARHSETNTDVWSSSLALVLRVVRHAVSAALNSIQAPHNVAVALHEAALRALASAASEADVLSRVAVGAPAGLPAVARSVGPCVWPSEQYVLLLQSLPPVAVRGGEHALAQACSSVMGFFLVSHTRKQRHRDTIENVLF